MRTVLLMFLMAFTLSSGAQDVFSNKMNMALERVVRDFPNRFHNIKGDLLNQRNQVAEYRSTVQVPGSASCVVMRRTASNNDSYSWSCVAFEHSDFDMARNRFKEVYEQIENTIIKIDGEKPFIISGQYKVPVEDSKTTTVVFDLLPAVGEMKRLKIELSLRHDATNWKVELLVYDNSLKDEQATVAN